MVLKVFLNREYSCDVAFLMVRRSVSQGDFMLNHVWNKSFHNISNVEFLKVPLGDLTASNF